MTQEATGWPRTLLGAERHSARTAARSVWGTTMQPRSRAAAAARLNLFIAKGLDGVEVGGASCGIESGGEAHDNGKRNRAQDEPPGNGKHVSWGQILAL